MGTRLRLWPADYSRRWAVTLAWPDPAQPGHWQGTVDLANGFGMDWSGPEQEPDAFVLNSVPVCDNSSRTHRCTTRTKRL